MPSARIPFSLLRISKQPESEAEQPRISEREKLSVDALRADAHAFDDVAGAARAHRLEATGRPMSPTGVKDTRGAKR